MRDHIHRIACAILCTLTVASPANDAILFQSSPAHPPPAFYSPLPPASNEPVDIAGTAVFDDGTSAVGATVLVAAGAIHGDAVPEEALSATVDARGTFHLNDVPVNFAFLRAWHPDAAPSVSMYLRRGSGATYETNPEVALRRRIDFTGTVTDGPGTPQPGARVYALVPGEGVSAVISTDEKGSFTLGRLPGSGFALAVEDDGFAPALLPIKPGTTSTIVKLDQTSCSVHGQIIPYDGTTTLALRMSMLPSGPRGGPGSGYYAWAGAGEGQVPVTVQSDGRFHAAALPVAAYTVEVSRKGVALPREYVAIDCNPPGEVILPKTDTPSSVTVRLFPSTPLTVKLIDAETSEPMEGLRVEFLSATSGPGHVMSNATGQAALPGVPAGRRFSIKITGKGYRPADQEKTLGSDMYGYDVYATTATEEVVIPMLPPVAISGVVVDEATSAPAGGARVAVYPAIATGKETVVADAAGRFSTATPRVKQVHVSARDERGNSGKAVVEIGSNTSTTIVLQPRVNFKVVVVDSAGRPVPQAHVQVVAVSGKGEQVGATMTNVNGSGEISDVLISPLYKFSVVSEGKAPFETVLPIGPEKKVTLTLPKEITLSGRVLDKDDNPVAGAQIRVSDQSQSFTYQSARSTTSDAGEFTLSGVTSGPQTLIVDVNGSREFFRDIKPGPNAVLKLGQGVLYDPTGQSPFARRGAIPRTYTGRVVDENNKPMPDVRVHAFMNMHSISPRKGMTMRETIAQQHRYSPTTSTLTDADGRFQFQATADPNIAYAVDVPGYLPVSETDQTRYSGRGEVTSAPIALPEIKLQVEALISGVVADENGTPVPGAQLYLAHPRSDERGVNTFSNYSGRGDGDADGRFSIAAAAGGEYMVRASAPGYGVGAVVTTAPASQVLVQVWKQTASVAGRAVLMPDKPLADVRVSIHSKGPSMTAPLHPPLPPMPANMPSNMMVVTPKRPTTVNLDLFTTDVHTAPDGTFSIAGLSPGTYYLSSYVKSEKGTTGPKELAIIPNPVILQSGENKTGVEVRYHNGLTIHGQVLVEGTSITVPGARVYLGYNKEKSVVADAEGRYQFDALRDIYGSARLLAEKPGYQMPTPRNWSEPRPVELELSKDQIIFEQNILMHREMAIEGVVLDKKTSEPIVGAQVVLVTDGSYHYQKEGEKALRTGSDGTFRLLTIPGSPVRVRSIADGYGPVVSPPITMSNAADTTGLRLLLDPGVVLTGRVLNPDNSPATEGYVSIHYSIQGTRSANGLNNYYSESFTGQVGEGGMFKRANLPAGDVTLTAYSGKFAPSDIKVVTLSPESLTSAQLTLRQPFSLGGVVVLADGIPLKAGRVSFSSTDRTRDSVGGDLKSDGSFLIERVPEGDYYAMIHNPEKRMMEYFKGFKAGQTDIRIQLGSGSNLPPQAEGRQTRSASTTRVTLYGLVTDFESGQPVEKFEVYGSQGIEIRRDPDKLGGFIATGLMVSTPYQMLRIVADGYAPYDSGVIYIPPGKVEVRQTFKMGPGGIVTGRAISSATGKPIPGISVALTGEEPGGISQAIETQTAVTGADGTFTLKGLGRGRKMLEFTPPADLGYVAVRMPTDVVYNDTTEMGDIEFGSGGAIKGRLVTAPGDVPVPNAEITIRGNTGSNPNKTTTDADGRFLFDKLLDGLFFVEAPKYGANSWIGLEPLETKELILQSGTGSLIGTVMREGAPHSASIRAVRTGAGQSVARFTNSANDGRFTITDLPPGRWEIQLTSTKNSAWSTSAFVEIPEDGSPIEKTFTFPSASIVVTVVDSSGQVVEGASVVGRAAGDSGAPLPPSAAYGETDANGQATLGGLSPGSYTVVAEKDVSGRGETAGISVAETGSVPASVTLSPGAGGTLISLAMNVATGTPVQPAWCYLFKPDGTLHEHNGQRDETGTMMIENIPAGTYRVQVSAFSHSVGEHTITIAEGQTQTIEDYLYPAGAFRWALKDAAGNPVAGIRCRLEPTDPGSVEKPREGESDSQGMFIVRGLFPGTYTAVAQPKGGAPIRVPIKIFAGNPTDQVTKIE